MFKDNSLDLLKGLFGAKKATKRKRSTKLTAKQLKIQNSKIAKAVRRASSKAYKAGRNAKR